MSIVESIGVVVVLLAVLVFVVQKKRSSKKYKFDKYKAPAPKDGGKPDDDFSVNR